MKKVVLKFFKKFWSREFLFYFLTGFSAFVFDISTLLLLKEGFGFSPVFAVVVNQILITSFVFFVNKIWTFHSKSLVSREAFRFLVVAIFNYFVAIIWMSCFFDYFGFNYLLVRLANVVLAVSWNFLLYKYFVYRR